MKARLLETAGSRFFFDEARSLLMRLAEIGAICELALPLELPGPISNCGVPRWPWGLREAGGFCNCRDCSATHGTVKLLVVKSLACARELVTQGGAKRDILQPDTTRSTNQRSIWMDPIAFNYRNQNGLTRSTRTRRKPRRRKEEGAMNQG